MQTATYQAVCENVYEDKIKVIAWSITRTPCMKNDLVI